MSKTAEAGVLQGLVSEPELIDTISYLKPYMFENQAFRDIYETFIALAAEKNKFSIQTVIGRLAAGNNSYTEEFLTEFVRENLIGGAFAYEIESHAKVVFNDYKKRATIAVVQKYNPDTNRIEEDLQGLIDQLQGLQINIEEDGKSLAEITREIKDNYFKPKNTEFLEFGIPEIDEAVGGIDGGDIVVVAARPGVGKSAFILQAMRHISQQGKRIAYFNLEMLREQVFERAVSSASGIQMTAVRRHTQFHNNERTDYERGVKQLLSEENIIVYQGDWTVSRIRAVQAKSKFDVIVIDYLQLLEPDTNKRAGNRTAEVGDISRGLKKLATDYKIPIVALSQINRVSENLKTKEPSMSELRESGSIEQDASVILMLWLSNDVDNTERGLKVEKARNGRTHKMTMNFDGAHMSFDAFTKLKGKEIFIPVPEEEENMFE